MQREAFPTPDEADLALRLLERPEAVRLSLVAEREGRVEGHVLYTPIRLEGSPKVPGAIVALGPIGVRPACQRRGVGSALIDEGTRRLTAAGAAAVVVLGDPAYYGRFGFAAASGFGVTWALMPDTPAFQAMELEKHALAGGGVVHYAPEFDGV